MSVEEEKERLWEVLLSKLEKGPQRYTSLEKVAVRENRFSSAMFRSALRKLKTGNYISQEKVRAPYKITEGGFLWLESRRKRKRLEQGR